jgi:XTP/dITP diphosphohydrolase
MNKNIVLATRNQHKQREMQQLLNNTGWQVFSLQDFPNCPEVTEDGDTFLANAAKKAIEVSTHCGVYALADDSGLVVDALNGAPGVYSARYAHGEDSTDEENNARVLKELEGIPHEKRTARFVCAAVLADGNNVLFSTEQTVEGFIQTEQSGEGGFGYDPLFFYPPYNKTLAQATAEEKNAVSHRGKSMRAVAQFLESVR